MDTYTDGDIENEREEQDEHHHELAAGKCMGCSYEDVVLIDQIVNEDRVVWYATGDGGPHHCGPYCEHPGQNGVHEVEDHEFNSSDEGMPCEDCGARWSTHTLRTPREYQEYDGSTWGGALG